MGKFLGGTGEVAVKDNQLTPFLDPARLRVTTLNVDTSTLNEGYRRAVRKLLRILSIMGLLFLMQDHQQSIGENLQTAARTGGGQAKQRLEVFGIFDGLIGVTKDGKPVPLFSGGIGRPPGSTVYGEGITAGEIDAYVSKHLERRAEFDRIDIIIECEDRDLIVVQYHERYMEQLKGAATLLRSAAEDVDGKSFADCLRVTADAFVAGD